jgi:hypothetical protein
VTETCLRALVPGARAWTQAGECRIRVNGREIDLPLARDDPGGTEFPLPPPPAGPEAKFELEVLAGEGPPLQVVMRQARAWERASPGRADAPRTSLAIALRVARPALSVGEALEVEVQLDHVGSIPVWRSAVRLDVPPCFELDPRVFADWVSAGKILAAVWRPGGWRVDLGFLKPKERRIWKLALTARARGRVRLPPVSAVEVYGPQAVAWSEAAEVEIL